MITFTDCYYNTFLSIEPHSLWTFARKQFIIPNLTIQTRFFRRNTDTIMEYFSCYTKTSSFVVIPYFSSLTWICDTIFTIPNCRRGALASPCVLVPHHPTLAALNHNTELAIPLCSRQTFTRILLFTPNLPVYTLNTELAIPIKF